MKKLIRRAINKWITALANSSPVYRKKIDEITSVDKGMQILLTLKYREMRRTGDLLPSFDEIEFRTFSQNGEDGILLYIFSLIGTTNKEAVEICAGDGIECNAANLIINHGWTGLLFDGDEAAIRQGQEFYASHPDTFTWPPQFVHAWVARENVNSLISSRDFTGEIDLLSLDLDGIDYWIWKEITCISPRVVVVEYQDAWGPDKAVTVAYRADFRARHLGYAGASLAAFVKLGREKGYRLVGCQRYGFNAFFVRTSIAEDLLPEISPSACFDHSRHARKVNLALLNEYEWVEV